MKQRKKINKKLIIIGTTAILAVTMITVIVWIVVSNQEKGQKDNAVNIYSYYLPEEDIANLQYLYLEIAPVEYQKEDDEATTKKKQQKETLMKEYVAKLESLKKNHSNLNLTKEQAIEIKQQLLRIHEKIIGLGDEPPKDTKKEYAQRYLALKASIDTNLVIYEAGNIVPSGVENAVLDATTQAEVYHKLQEIKDRLITLPDPSQEANKEMDGTEHLPKLKEIEISFIALVGM